MSSEWLDLIKREAANAVAARQFEGTVVATSYNPTTHSIKGILVPHGIETGDIPIEALHVGSGYGILIGPKIGDAQALDGDQFSVKYDFGDPNTMVAKHKQFSTPDSPPQVQPGEYLMQDPNGNKIYFAQDKTLTVVGQNGSESKHRVDGSISHKPALGQFVYSGGDPDDGGTFSFVMTVDGPSTTHKSKVG